MCVCVSANVLRRGLNNERPKIVKVKVLGVAKIPPIAELSIDRRRRADDNADDDNDDDDSNDVDRESKTSQ